MTDNEYKIYQIHNTLLEGKVVPEEIGEALDNILTVLHKIPEPIEE